MSKTTTPPKPGASKTPDTTQQPQPPQSQQPTMSNPESTRGNWTELAGFAKKYWHKLTEIELLNSGGDEQKLTSLVKDRYAINRDEANRQVKGFFTKQGQ